LFVARPQILGEWEITEIQIDFSDSQDGLGQLLGIGQDGNGELYLLTKAPGIGATGNSGVIYKVISAE
jgi:hypothetical protein